jgi:hypothetical protein
MPLSLEALLQRLRNGEDNLTEWKVEGVNQHDLRQTLCAFANSAGEHDIGVLFIGIDDSGVPLGVLDTDSRQKDVRRAAEICYPPIKFTSSVVNVDGKRIVAVQVPFTSGKPHFSGPAYVRKGSESVAAPQAMFEALIASRSDKARRILQYREQIRSVRWLTLPEFPPREAHLPGLYSDVNGRWYEIVGCDAEYLRFQDRNFRNQYTIPLKYVELDYDSATDALVPVITRAYLDFLGPLHLEKLRITAEEQRFSWLLKHQPRQAIRESWSIVERAAHQLCSAADLERPGDLGTLITTLIGARYIREGDIQSYTQIWEASERAARDPRYSTSAEEAENLHKRALELANDLSRIAGLIGRPHASV